MTWVPTPSSRARGPRHDTVDAHGLVADEGEPGAGPGVDERRTARLVEVEPHLRSTERLAEAGEHLGSEVLPEESAALVQDAPAVGRLPRSPGHRPERRRPPGPWPATAHARSCGHARRRGPPRPHDGAAGRRRRRGEQGQLRPPTSCAQTTGRPMYGTRRTPTPRTASSWTSCRSGCRLASPFRRSPSASRSTTRCRSSASSSPGPDQDHLPCRGVGAVDRHRDDDVAGPDARLHGT